ncbi:MAG: OmpA family protein [Elusimicrobiota bacterium]
MPLRKSRNMIDANDPRVSQFGHPAPPWMVNYADLMTELVCFFVILYALGAALNKDMQNAQEKIQELLKEGTIQGKAEMTKEGLKLTLEEQGKIAFFESGKADVTPDMNAMLDKLAPVFDDLKNDILVEGHTDNRPINSPQFPSNWELSTARATSIIKYLINSKGMAPKRLSAIGYGEFRPVAVNDSEENMQKNRRVVFLIKTESYKSELQAEENAEEGTAGEQTTGVNTQENTQVEVSQDTSTAVSQ